MNLPCTITFFTLSAAIIRMEERLFHSEIYQRLEKHLKDRMGMELKGIDWKLRRYSITAQQFFTPD